AIFSSAGPVAAATVFGAVFGIRRAPRLTIVAGAFLLLHQLFPHRDLRFIYPAWPAVCAVAGLGFGWLSRRDRALRGVVCTVLAVGCIGFTVWKLPRLTFGDLRQAETLGVRPARSAHGLHGDVNRVLARAGRLPELCGLKLHRILAVETGGLTYLHRDVPVYHPLQPAPSEAHYNYTVARDSAVEGRGSEEIDRVRRMGETSLVRTGGTSCETDLDYRPRIDRPAKLSKGGDADSPRVSSTRRRRAAAPGS
ncbi:MAG: hypothetical protein ABEL76_07155, partial [Bradymonadaceae bacterium]